jgi:hypothetical protein
MAENEPGGEGGSSSAGKWVAVAVALIGAVSAISVAWINNHGDENKKAPGGQSPPPVDKPKPEPEQLLPFTVSVRQEGNGAGGIAGANLQLIMNDGVAFDVTTSDHGLYTFNLKPDELTGKLSVYKDGYAGVGDLGVNISGDRYEPVLLPLATGSTPTQSATAAIAAPSTPSATPGTPPTAVPKSLKVTTMTHWIQMPLKPLSASKFMLNPANRLAISR